MGLVVNVIINRGIYNSSFNLLLILIYPLLLSSSLLLLSPLLLTVTFIGRFSDQNHSSCLLVCVVTAIPITMPPTLHLIRHAQGYHNLKTANQSIHDPLLTPYGRQQCTHLQEIFPYPQDVDLIVASPLKRTIYTALYSLEKIIASKDMTIIALPEVQETSDLPCDTGSDVAELKHEFEGKKIDYTLVKEDWNTKKGKWAPTTKEIEERCKTARKWLMERKEEHIVVVTHGGVLHYLTEDWSGFEGFMGKSQHIFNGNDNSTLT